MTVGNRVAELLKGIHRLPVRVSRKPYKSARFVQTFPRRLFSNGFHESLRVGNPSEFMENLHQSASVIAKRVVRLLRQGRQWLSVDLFDKRLVEERDAANMYSVSQINLSQRPHTPAPFKLHILLLTGV